MSDEQKKKVGIVRSLWSKIEDLDSANEAAKVYGAVLAGYFAFSYAIKFLLIYFSAIPEVISNNFDYYYQLIEGVTFIIFFIFAAHRVYRKKKFGLIPFLSFYALFEIGFKLYLNPGNGIVMSFLVTVMAINAFRGWLGIRKYQKN